MKILSIKEPRQLDDGTVKASITVSDDNFIPLIVLIKDAREGAEIDLDVRKSDDEPEHDSIWEFVQRQARELEKRLRAEREIGQKEGIDMSRSLYIIGNPEIVHESLDLINAEPQEVVDGILNASIFNEGINDSGDPDHDVGKFGVRSSVFKPLVESPERQAEVIKAHDKVEDNKSPYAPATDRY